MIAKENLVNLVIGGITTFNRMKENELYVRTEESQKKLAIQLDLLANILGEDLPNGYREQVKSIASNY